LIERAQIMSLLLDACPSYRTRWDEYTSEPEYGADLYYVHLGDFAHHLVALYQAGRTSEFSSVFEVVEQLIIGGDAFVSEAAVIGLLEGIQNVAGWQGTDPEEFVPHLMPESAKWWEKLNRFWAGDITALRE
jgi:hypothetical protein